MNGEKFYQYLLEILKEIPEEFHSAVRYHAFDLGNAYGYNETVLSHVQNLVDMLKDPIIKYTERLTNKN